MAARIAVLTEMPATWERYVQRWREMAGEARGLSEERPAPSAPLEYLFYQTLVGAWPFGADAGKLGDLEQRLSQYLLKAAREAKIETSWLTPSPEYETGVSNFVHALFKRKVFLDDVARFCAQIDVPAAVNALGQALLRSCAPGVPDTYQGSELWNQSLVDPDNRRTVDYELRRRYLSEIGAHGDSQKALARHLLDRYADGRVKLYVLHHALKLRQAKPELFAQGDYVALDGGEHVVAFMRCFEGERMICAAPRLSYKLCLGKPEFPLGQIWGQGTLRGAKPGRYRNLLSGDQLLLGESTALSQVFADFPLALLIEEGE